MNELRGILSACAGASLWAISGISGEILFNQFHFSAAWLVSARLFFSGIILLILTWLMKKKEIFQPLKDKRDLIELIAFAFFGMFAVQFTYFKTIELSSASFATIIQYTGPFFVIIYESFKIKKMPALATILLMLVTLLGVSLIAFNGSLLQLFTSMESLFWGIGSAVALAFYSVQPRRLLEKYGSFTIVGWGMLLGSVVANVFHPVWKIDGNFTPASLVQILIVIVFGTAFAFLIYLSSLQFISSSLASILTAFEPILAMVLSIVLFQMSLNWTESVGFVLVLGSILLLQKRL